MLENELFKLSTTIPEFQEKEEIRKKIYETYQTITVHRRFHIRIKPVWIISTAMMIILVFIGIFHTNRNTIIAQFNYLKKDPTLSVVGELEKHSIVEQVYTVGKQMEYNINDLFSYGLLNQQQLEAVKKYESDLELKEENHPIFQKQNNNSSLFTYHFCIGQKEGNDIIILIDNHSDEEYLIYSSFDLDLGYKQEEMISIYQKHNQDIAREQNELLQLDCTISNDQTKHTYSSLENCNPVNYILSTDSYKVMSIYANVSASHLNQIDEYYSGYNKDSLSYISDLKFEGKEEEFPLACSGYPYRKPLKERIDGIANNNQTIYEIECSINNSPLLGVYVSKETYDLIEIVKKYTPLVYRPIGYYPTNMALYYSLLERNYILDNLTWFEFEYNAGIPSELDGKYLLEFYQYQTITIIRDIIHKQNINYSITIMKKPALYKFSSRDNNYYVNIEESNSKTMYLKYASYYDIEFFKSINDQMIMRDIANNRKEGTIVEYIDMYNNHKVVRYSDELFVGGNYDSIYARYLEQLNNILLEKKAKYLPYPRYLKIVGQSDPIINEIDIEEYIFGYDYYFDYELWIDFIHKAVENYDLE